ncbi:STAS domain-containing protein [Thauera sp.]|jgi:anti-anti-sigma factor|uniref:STAS domain-containing protein n=1 Tax=Thauera sp. TaxID=1905334 RepID=UPI001A3AB666|nr:STAS domain-containing protein [Thauera sp.]MBL8465866.1 STAS domain-containing protein [Thauera sp.]HRO37847.1 STAS domain-containing protein [Thauera sp.]
MPTRKKKSPTPLAFTEDMTIYHAAAQKQRLIDALEGCERLEIDLSCVNEIDTAGFQLLVLIKREARRLGKDAQIVAHSEAVRDILDFYNMAVDFGDPLLIPAEKT